jgi:hypothetical protein
MLIQEEYIEITADNKIYSLGESGLFEPFIDNILQLFRTFQSEYGKCISKLYIDLPDSDAHPVGWIFEKRVKYSDSKETYLQQVWVTLHDDEPEYTVKHNYHFLN